MSDPIVVGVDAGGTNVRVLVADTTGARLAVGTAGGANPISRGLKASVDEISAALSTALSTVDRARVRQVVIGIAGFMSLTDDELTELLTQTADGFGRGERTWRVVSDIDVAFAGGTPKPEGILLLSGTGAVAARVNGNGVVRILDGYGWLLGDDGSGYWLGREAVRATLAHLDGRGASTSLTSKVCDAFGVPTPKRRSGRESLRPITSAIYADEPVALSRLAPLVSQAAEENDAVAVEIIERATEILTQLVEPLLSGGPEVSLGDDGKLHVDMGEPQGQGDVVVLSGGVLLTPGPLRTAVRDELHEQVDEVTDGRDGAAGAAWCALRDLGIDSPAVHAKLTR